MGYGAVRLFVERATAADPHFRVDEKNIGAIVEVCRRLEGIPLGLELAAVRLRSLSLADLQRRLDDQLSLSNLNRSSAATRHKTLTATLDWSYELLDTEERLLWTRLSVFSGGFTFAAVEQVCSD